MNEVTAAVTALKKQLGDNLCIMGHHYQNDSVVAHCDFTGDSLELARRIPDIKAQHIVFCGVFFMGESAALLSKPGQGVYMPETDADCMMALMAQASRVRRVLEQLNATGRRIVPLAYVNTMLDLKALMGEYGGAVCTSANAETMLRWALKQGDGVLFLPDKHLGRNVAKKLGLTSEDHHILRLNGKGIVEPESQPLDRPLLLWPGACAIHARLKPEMVEAARTAHPGCRVIAHPECRPELIDLCDAAGSTSFIIKDAARQAEEAPGSTLIIGTEDNLVERLAARHKGRCHIHSLGRAICPHMAKVTEEKLLATLTAIAHGTAEPLTVEAALCDPARRSLTRMLEVCGQ